jgi:hypothetical protein
MDERAEGVRVSAHFDWLSGRRLSAPLLEGERVIVGSSPDCDVVGADSWVSRIYAVLHQLYGRRFVEDCGSGNGSEVNGHQLTSLRLLQPNDEVRLGRARLFCGQVSMGLNPTDFVITRRAGRVVSTACKRCHHHRASDRGTRWSSSASSASAGVVLGWPAPCSTAVQRRGRAEAW